MRAAVLAAMSAAAVLAALPASFAKPTTDIVIEPGPTVMSEREKAIVADPANGIQHAVILVDETDRDDNLEIGSEIAHHRRAKILSLEGRGLADIVIPVEHHKTSLMTWWGRTILPDGTVLELPREALQTQAVMKSDAGDYRSLKGALPGVVPGCVIDYGYVIFQRGLATVERLLLQQDWPVQSFRYRWAPNRRFAWAYTTSRAEGFTVDVQRGDGAVLFTASELSVVPDEPFMPPPSEARGSVTFFYTNGQKAPEYWAHAAKRTETALRDFLDPSIRQAIAVAGLSSSASISEKLRAAYDWIGANIKNTSLLTAEEVEARDESENAPHDAKTVLAAKAGSPRQLDFLYAGMARELGAEAHIVYAVDRTKQFWNPSLRSFDQFAYTFVAIRAPGEPESATIFVDAGSGLPYGQVPWRATGVNAFLCKGKGSSIGVPPAPPIVNRADTYAKLVFSENNSSARVQWVRTANGATGLESRRWLRDIDSRRRKEALDAICGASDRTEVTAAELPGLEETSVPFRFACDLAISDMNVGEDMARYSLRLIGPWWPKTAEFPAAKRVQTVIFPFPRPADDWSTRCVSGSIHGSQRRPIRELEGQRPRRRRASWCGACCDCLRAPSTSAVAVSDPAVPARSPCQARIRSGSEPQTGEPPHFWSAAPVGRNTLRTTARRQGVRDTPACHARRRMQSPQGVTRKQRRGVRRPRPRG